MFLCRWFYTCLLAVHKCSRKVLGEPVCIWQEDRKEERESRCLTVTFLALITSYWERIFCKANQWISRLGRNLKSFTHCHWYLTLAFHLLVEMHWTLWGWAFLFSSIISEHILKPKTAPPPPPGFFFPVSLIKKHLSSLAVSHTVYDVTVPTNLIF